MSNDTIPDRLQTREQMLRGLSKGQTMEQAAALRSAVVWQSNASNEVIAHALVAAEARGRDTAIGILQSEIDNPTSHDPSICLDAAIRKLQESSDEA